MFNVFLIRDIDNENMIIHNVAKIYNLKFDVLLYLAYIKKPICAMTTTRENYETKSDFQPPIRIALYAV